MFLNLLTRIFRRQPDGRAQDEQWQGQLGRAIELQNSAELDAAEQLLKRLLLQRPRDGDTLHLLGSLMMRQGRHAEAVAVLIEVIALQPESAEAHFNLGTACSNLGQFQNAATHFAHAAELRPGFAEAHLGLGNALKASNEPDAAEDAYRNALKLTPQSAETFYNLGNLCHQLGRGDEAVECYRRAIELQPSFVAAHSNYVYALNFLPGLTPEEVFDAHLAWARQHAEPFTLAVPGIDCDATPERPLRIGYVSPNFREHAVSYFFGSVLAAHDRRLFHTVCYSDVQHEDAMTERLKRAAGSWHDCSGDSDDLLAQRIRADRIDILVDLTGHTERNRLQLFARRPAPVQITWNGYANTTGMSAMDFRISDPVVDPPGMTDHFHAERLLRLPEVYMVYCPPADAPPVGDLPAARDGRVTFGSMNALSKLSAPVVQLWARILHALPEAGLLLVTVPAGRTRERLAGLFAAHGIDVARLEMHDRLPQQEFLRMHHRIDIALDPFPFSGTTTTCQSLWMGVPVITLSGRVHASRVTTGMLTSIGLTELIAGSEDEYVNIATHLAENIGKMAELRSSLRQRMLNSPLTDAGRFTRNLEDAYRTVWKDWCGRRAQSTKAETS